MPSLQRGEGRQTDTVISDSEPWKAELLKTADRLDRRSIQERWTDRSGFLVERDIMLGAYAIRKLLDTPAKISDEARRAKCPSLGTTW
jgi:hypothetical protein